MNRRRALLAGGAALAAGAGRAAAAELVIGQVAQLTEPQAVGNQLRRGALLHFSAVNRDGGVHGQALKLVARSRGAEAADSLKQTRHLLAEARPIALMNLMGTGSMDALLRERVLEAEGVPVVGIRTGAVSLHEPVHPWLFHTRASYRAEIAKVLRHFTTLGVERVALVNEASAFGQEVQRHAEAERPGRQGFVTRQALDVARPDVPAAVDAIARSSAQAVLLAMPSPLTSDVYAAMRGRGLSAHVIALSTTDATQVVKRIGVARAHGLGIAQVTPDPSTAAVPVSREFQRMLKAAQAPAEDWNQAGLEGYIAARVLVEGLRRAGPQPTRAGLRQALETLSAFDLGGYVIELTRASHSGSRFVDIAILDRQGRLLR
jgi:branched-chain amino acid transport system substrate-binding protein